MSDEARGEKAAGWSRMASTTLLTSPWFEVRRDTAVRPDGSRGDYDHVVSPGSATVVAMTDDGKVVVTRQWIYLHEGRQWRLPSGRIDADDLNPMASARRELREETGISAEHWRAVGAVNCADSFTNHRDHAFLATGLRHGAAELEPGEADLEVHLLPFAEVLGLVTGGEMPHAGSAYALLMVRTLGLAH